MRIAIGVVVVGLAFSSLAQEQSNSWSVDEDRTSYSLFEMNAQEGTWMSLDVAPDGEKIVFDLLGHLYEMSVDGGEAVRITDGRSWNMFPRYSPNGKLIAFTSDRGGSNDLWIYDRAKESYENVSSMDFPVFQGTWSKDGRHLYGTALNMNP